MLDQSIGGESVSIFLKGKPIPNDNDDVTVRKVRQMVYDAKTSTTTYKCETLIIH